MARRARLAESSEAKLNDILDGLLDVLDTLELLRKEPLMATLTALAEAVKANTDVTRSAITLINGLASRIAECNADPAKLDELIKDLRRDAGELSDAVVANTPAPIADPGPSFPPAEPAPPAPEPEPVPTEPQPTDPIPAPEPTDPSAPGIDPLTGEPTR